MKTQIKEIAKTVNDWCTKLEWTDKNGHEDTLYAIRDLTGKWFYTSDTNPELKKAGLKTVLRLAQSIRSREGVIINEDTIQTLENEGQNKKKEVGK